MKKVYSFIVTILITAGIAVCGNVNGNAISVEKSTSPAPAALSPTATIQTVTGITPGNTTSVDVSLSNFSTPFAAFQFSIKFDTNTVILNSISDWASGVTGVSLNYHYNGSIADVTFVWGDTPVSINGLFFRMNFKYKSSAHGCSSIYWSDDPTPRLFADINGYEVAVSYIDGQVCSIPVCAVDLSSAAGTDAQTTCINTPITDITYATTLATDVTVSGLPTGVTGSWAADVFTISGTPTFSGTYTYTVTTQGCGPVSTTGTITVTPNNTISLTAGGPQTVYATIPITTTTYSTTGATDATVTGLPSGVTGSWSSNVVTITGTPTTSGTYTYTVTLTGGCGTVTTQGTITVLHTPIPTATIATVTNACPGSAVSVDISLSEFLTPLIGFQFTIRYDTTYLDFVDITNWATPTQNAGVSYYHNYYGNIEGLTFVWGDADNTSLMDGVLCRLNFNLRSSVVGCQNYTWSDAPTVRVFADLSHDITVTYVNGSVCPITPEAISGNTSICTTASSTLTGTHSGGTWNSSNPGVASIGSSSGVVNGVSVGTSLITYTVATVCGTATATSTVTVSNGAPGAVSVSGGAIQCGGNVTLTATGGTGGTIYWQGTSSVGTSTAFPSASQTITTSGIYYFRAHNGCGWSAASSASVTINPVATPTFTSSPSGTECGAHGLVYTTQSGMTNYTWNLPGTQGVDYTITSGSTASTSNTVTISWLTTGSKTVTVDYSNSFGCPGSSPASSTTTISGFAVTSTYTGTGDWSNASNWSNGIPASCTDAVINGTCTITSAAECSNLTINPAKSLTLNSGQTLNVYGQFLIMSTAAGTGSYINNGTANYSYQPKVQRYVPLNVWHYITAPVQGALSGVWLNLYLKDYNESSNSWNILITPTTVPMPVGRGYALFSNGANVTRTYTGNLNEGNHVIPLSWSGSNRGNNLIGNVFTSAISADINTWTKTNVDNSIWVWNPGSGNYQTWNGTSGTLTGGVIPASQGFIVKANNSGASVTIMQSKRQHSTVAFHKDIVANNLLITASGNNYSDGLVVNFNNNATNDFDHDFDVEKIVGLPEAPQISTIWSGKKLSINVIPEITEYTVIPFSFNCNTSGIFTLTTDGISTFDPNLPISLQDVITGTITDLRTEPVYQFTHVYDPVSTINRFNLIFGENNITRVEENNSANLNIYSFGQSIAVENPTLVKLVQIAVYNNIGQIVKMIDSPENTSKIIINANLAAGAYLITAIDEKGNSTIKKVSIQ